VTASAYALRAANADALAKGGTAGQMLTGTGSVPAWSGSPALSGNLTLVTPSTATTGNILKGANRFIHNFGSLNTFIGENAGNFTMTGSANTGSGAGALAGNSGGNLNTASGWNALASNATGSQNTATGINALAANTSGNYNTGYGANALSANTTGINNTATGRNALRLNSTGYSNVAVGVQALESNSTGANNAAVGTAALNGNDSGSLNTAIGDNALVSNVSGNNNIAVGYYAGSNLTTGANNIDIGSTGVAGESGTIRIGLPGFQSLAYIQGIYNAPALFNGATVFVEPDGRLGTNPSSRRYKDDIADMSEASNKLMNLRPVTFHYKNDHNPAGRTLQYGLVAEEVAAIYPGLVARSADGQIEAVMYQFLAPMLLNEYQRLQRTIEAQTVAMSKQATRIAELEQDRRTQVARIDALEMQALEVGTLKLQMAQVAQMQQQASRRDTLDAQLGLK